MILKVHKLVQADRYYDALVQGINLLAKDPDIGTTCDDIREGYRRFKIKRHIIFYKISLEILTIVRVLHERIDITQYIEK